MSIKTPAVKKRIGNVIDMNTNATVKESKGYKYWATKHNLNTMQNPLSLSENMALNSLSSLMIISGKQPMKSKIYRIKSRLLTKKYRCFLPL